MTDITDQECQWLQESQSMLNHWHTVECNGNSVDIDLGHMGFVYCPYCRNRISEVEGGDDE